LPTDSTYRPEGTFTWVYSHELVTDHPAWMVSDLVTSPPGEGILREVDTNGLAAGNTHLEAAVHGLCEVIERDAFSQQEFFIEFGTDRLSQPMQRWINLESLEDDAGSWVERIRSSGLKIVLHDITSDIGVATVRALLTDPCFFTPVNSKPAHFLGVGTHPCSSTAVFRAISEAVQGRLSVIQGARDDYNTFPSSMRSYTKACRTAQLKHRTGIQYSDIVSVWHDDLLEDLKFLVDRLTQVGFEQVVLTDLTRPNLAIPVVRVRVPGLSSFVVNRRRVDWRCLRHLL
jgi:YcaO-like protein with predicted kinase domain